MTMRASVLRILVILGVAAGASYIRARNLPWVPDVEAIKAKEDLSKILRAELSITLGEFQTLIDQGAVVIDARPQEAYEQGHLETDYYPPVLNVPAEEIDAHFDRLMHPDLQGLSVVLYCASETCEYAEELYVALAGLGFDDIRIYFPGWEGIVAAGLPTAAGPDTWTGFDDESMDPPDDGYEAYGTDEEANANTPDEVEP